MCEIHMVISTLMFVFFIVVRYQRNIDACECREDNRLHQSRQYRQQHDGYVERYPTGSNTCSTQTCKHQENNILSENVSEEPDSKREWP
jgi:hypothetical protein